MSEGVSEGGRATLQFQNFSLQVLTVKLTREQSEAALCLEL